MRRLMTILLFVMALFFYIRSAQQENLAPKNGSAIMVASWYGKWHHGRLRADGKRYDMYDPTVVAHKTLPLGTKLELENLENGKKIVVTVRDRGPYLPGRHLDLSYAAAKKLGMIREGVVPVMATVLSLPETRGS